MRIGGDDILDFRVPLCSPRIELVQVHLHLCIYLTLELRNLGVEIGIELRALVVVLGTEVSGSVVKDVLDVVAGLAGLLLSELSVGDVLLAFERLPVGASGLEPSVDDLLVVAVADDGILDLASELIHGNDELGWFFYNHTIAVIARAVGVVHHSTLSAEVVSALHGNRSAELVEGEGLRCSRSISLGLGEELLNLREGLIEGLTVNEGVVGDEVKDLLFSLHIHLILLMGELFDLGEEIVPGSGDGGLVGLPSINPLLVHQGVSGLFLGGPSLDCRVIDISEGDLREVGHDERVGTIGVLLEHILQLEGGLDGEGLVVVGLVVVLGGSKGSDHARGKSGLHGFYIIRKNNYKDPHNAMTYQFYSNLI